MLVRGALAYFVTPHWSLRKGCGYVPTFDLYRDEHLSYQQAQYDTTLLPFNF